MNEFTPVIDFVSRFINLTDDEVECFAGLLRTVKIKKRQFTVQPKFVCQHMSFIAEGAMRAYMVDGDGNEHTIALGIEGWCVNDYSSYILQEPATFFVEALEDSTLIQLSYKNEQLLYQLIPKFERCFRITAQRAAASIQRRILSNISMTAEERYEELASRYPRLLQRIPQYAIASYLGFTTEYLSKIRNKKSKKS